MPELDGMELLAKVRGADSPYIRHLPVIIISGEEDEETRQRCVARGANDFVTKSAYRTEMLARVKANLDLAETRRTLEASRTAQENTATVDVETGVASSHLLALQLDQLHAFAVRHASALALTLVRIDEFTALEQKLGERLSVQMLSMLAKLLQAKLRREDTFAHLDGPLFAIASPGSSPEGMRILAERLQQTVHNARINFRGEKLAISASLAVVSHPHDPALSAHDFFEKAMARLDSDPASGSLILPSLDHAQPLPPQLGEALAMLQRGEEALLRPHIPALLAGLLPILELANDEMQLGWQLDRLKH
jgi:diguanylate cyclase (GGDEF)-like protein